MSDILEIVKQIIKEDVLKRPDWDGKKVMGAESDSQALNWNVHALTHQISTRVGLPMDKTRYRLNKLEKDGKLISKRHPGWVSAWFPVGYLDELKKAVKS